MKGFRNNSGSLSAKYSSERSNTARASSLYNNSEQEL